MKSFIIILFIATIFAGCIKEVDMDAELEAMLATDRAIGKKALDIGVVEAFRELMLEDAMQMPDNALPTYGRENICKDMEPVGAKYNLFWEPVDGQVSKSGDMGWSWGKATFTSKDTTGGGKVFYTKYLNLWVKDSEGNWKVKIDIGNSRPSEM